MMLNRGKDTNGYRFYSDSRGLTGRIRKDLPENLFTEFIRDPDGLMDSASSRLVKDGPKTKVVQHVFQNSQGLELNVVAKRFHYGAGLRRLGFLFFPSPAMRCLKGALLLNSNGILTPSPLAAFEYRSWKGLGTSYYVSEEVADSCSLQYFRRSLQASLPVKRRLAVSRSILRDLARLLSRLHSMGIYHRDMKTSNILIQGWETDRRRLILVDLDRVVKKRRLPLAKRIVNLLQVQRRAWNEREGIYFFTRYAELFYASKKDTKAFVRKVLAVVQRKRARRRRERLTNSGGAHSR
jgi:serine/threonine protein kinase